MHTSTRSSPKLRENLASHAERVRLNAEVIPLVRDVPLDVHVEQLTLGGWDTEKARLTFADLELRTVWPRFVAVMADGLLGDPAPGSGPVGPGPGPGPADDDGGVDQALARPGWLDVPQWVAPADAPAAVIALEALFETARAGTGNVALAAEWSGDPGRSDLTALALGVETTSSTAGVGSGDATGPSSVHLGRSAGGGGPLLADKGVLAALAAGLGPGGVGVVAHDCKELMRSLLPLGVDIRQLAFDTAVAAYLLDPSNDQYRLADLVSEHLGFDMGDGEAGEGQGSFALDLSEESGDDTDGTTRPDAAALGLVRAVAVLARLREPLLTELAEVGEEALFIDVERPLVRVLARMEVVGVPVDRDVLRSIAAGLVDECGTLEAAMHELAGGPFNVNSVPQLRSVLYEQLGLAPVRKTKTGYSTDARTLELLRGQHPIIEVLLRYREVEKLRSTYGENLADEVADDGRIHATFRQTVARTGRLSSDRPNLHNIPVRTEEGRRFRQAFVPSAGRRLLVADYDQIELRAIADLSGDPGLTTAFAAGEDIHRTVAARVFGVDRDQVTQEQRSTAKMVSYGLAYGMEAYGLSQRLAVPVEEAQGILTAFFEAFPSVHDYMDRAVAEARESGYTVTAFGRRRPLPDLHSTNFQVRQAAERQARNAGIQGLAADLFKVALVRLDSGLEAGDLRSDLVLQVHDEVLVDVEPDEEAAVASLTEQAMTGAADLSVPLKVAMAWGVSWAEAKGG